jgi:photosystem II stability/assembly factor-like uncharacterized protein
VAQRDLGGTWALAVATGTPSLRRIERLPGGKLIAVGSAGTVVQSVDGGATWSPQPSGTSQRINSVRFLDDQNGWIAGPAIPGAHLERRHELDAGRARHGERLELRGCARKRAWVVGDNATAFPERGLAGPAGSSSTCTRRRPT